MPGVLGVRGHPPGGRDGVPARLRDRPRSGPHGGDRRAGLRLPGAVTTRGSTPSGNNLPGDSWDMVVDRRADRRMARARVAAGCDLERGVHQLRRLLPRRDRTLGVPVRRGRPRGPARADRAHPRHLARRASRDPARPALRVPCRRALGATARSAVQRRASCCSTPMPAQCRGEFRTEPPLFGHVRSDSGRGPGRCRATSRDSAPYVAKAVVVHDEFDWGGERPMQRRWRDTVIYELHVKGFTKLHDRIPEELRGTYAALGHPVVTDYLQRARGDRGGAAADPRVRLRAAPLRARPEQLLGIQLDRVLRAALGVLLRGRPRRAGHRVQADGQEPPRRPASR